MHSEMGSLVDQGLGERNAAANEAIRQQMRAMLSAYHLLPDTYQRQQGTLRHSFCFHTTLWRSDNPKCNLPVAAHSVRTKDRVKRKHRPPPEHMVLLSDPLLEAQVFPFIYFHLFILSLIFAIILYPVSYKLIRVHMFTPA